MKKQILIYLFLTLTFAIPANAQEWSFSDINKDWGRFLLGVAGGIAVHEIGHVVIAKSKGYDVSLKGTSIIYPNAKMSDSDALEVSSSGFQAQWIASEIVFLKHRLHNPEKKMSNISAGMVLSHIAISAVYLTFLKNHSDGDIYMMSESTGISRNVVALSTAIPALLDTWRLMGKNVPEWVPTVSLLSKGITMTYIWTF